MYLIKKIELNKKDNSINEEVIGYIKSELDAYAYIDSIEFNVDNTLDGIAYPYLTMTKLEKIKL